MTRKISYNYKRITKMFGLLFIAICMVTLLKPAEVEAAAAPKFYSQNIIIFKYPARPVGSWNQGFDIQNIQKKDKVSCKSSNSKILSVKAVKSDEGYYYILVDPRKAGTVTLSCTVKRGTKSYKISTKIKVINYKNPLSKFTIGKTKLLSNLDKDANATFTDTFKGKLSIKAASGWKIQAICLENYNNGKSKKITNGTTVTLDGKKWDHLRVDLKNIKGKYEETVTIAVHPK